MFDRHLFFGREAVARRTLEALGSRSVHLTGERRIGKTSFLHHLRGLLSASNDGGRRSYPVFVDLEAVTARDVFHALIEEAVPALPVTPRTLAELRLARGANAYLATDFACDVRLLVEDLELRTQPARLVFLIDEIDAVREGPASLVDAWLGRLLEYESPELRFVLAGVERGVLEAFELEPLAAGDAEALVREPVAGVFNYERDAVERILEVSRLRPCAIQRLCQHAVGRMLDEGRTTVRASDVAAAS